MIKIDLELKNSDEAMAVAQFLKRLTWSNIEALASSPEELYYMRTALDKVRKRLKEIGFDPR